LIVERTDYVSVPVRDLDRAAEFYGRTLGLTQIGHGQWPEFQLGENVSLYLLDLSNIGQEWQGPHNASIALRVPDVEDARSELEQKGVPFDGETLDTGVCRMAIFRDPDGNSLMLHRRYAPPES
jgi:catechol 2,3-dioxygenase-like lactoylglutathione lyase family enzyme